NQRLRLARLHRNTHSARCARIARFARWRRLGPSPTVGCMQQPEFIETIVIGGGQAGLAVGYHLSRSNLPFAILDASTRVGDAWRNRWDSLRLFSPARFNGLDGLPYPAPAHAFVTKDEMADYLEQYALHFQLPVRGDVRVDRLWREGDRFRLSAG